MKTESGYILVRREKPYKTTYLRKRPNDYKGKTEIHPNKLQSMINFGNKSIEGRGKTFEDHIELVRELTGTTIKEPVAPIALLEAERVQLRLQALNKGLPVSVVDELSVSKELEWREVLFPAVKTKPTDLKESFHRVR